MAGRCPNCLVKVDGVPNLRACTEPVRAGMTVRHQNAWPSLEHDLLSVLDRVDRLMPVGFYYKALHRPRLLWRLAQPVIRRVAGLGSLETGVVPEARYHHQNRHSEVAVVGGGPAGMSAALAAADGGVQVTLVDDQPSLGGSLRFDAGTYHDVPDVGHPRGFEAARELAARIDASANVQVLSNASAFGLYEGNLLAVLSGSHLIKLRAKRIVIATGSYEVPLVFDGNDLPGVMLATGAQRLMHSYGLKLGDAAVVATVDDRGYAAALDLLEASVRVVALVDSRSESPKTAAALAARGVPVLTSHAVARAVGKGRVEGVTVVRLEGGVPTAEERRFGCDMVCMSGGYQPATSLLSQAGASLGYDEWLDQIVPLELPPSVYAAGEVAGTRDLAASIVHGKQAGIEAAASLGPASAEGQVAAAEERLKGEINAVPQPISVAGGRKQFVCFCEDVTAVDIADAIDEGFDDIQTLKRYSTATMGPCQGKMCLKSFVNLCARYTGRGIDDTGVTTFRPPVQPVPLGALAGPSHMPIKRTPIDRKHRDLDAPMVDLGPWQRAYSYGSPQDECLAVRQRVGIIDVSTLGKLDVRGRDAPALLDKVYTHRFSDLRVGRIRYGVLCADNGAILDDGTVTRLAEDHYFVTTTTGNVELMEEWFKWWTAGTDMCAHVTNVTAAFAAINVAGPKARDTLVKLTEIDLSPTAFRYMRSRRDSVAGVQAMLLRIGFVGETGWELHFPAEYGEYMWDTLMEAGHEFGIAPFGLEAQRILRLEKGHIIVGQDTDAVSNPLESDMSWVVRFDREDFIGRAGLLAVDERGLRNKLVGFTVRDGRVPEDGDPIVEDGAPIGRVTSARLSPTLGKGFGLAWVPIELAQDGRTIAIRVDGHDVQADVTLRPVYDPDGLRLRE